MKKTALYDVHVAAGAKMVPFAGFMMPLLYTGMLEEHQRVRAVGGIFDVSHMGQFIVRGPQALEQVQMVTINDASRLTVYQAQYSAMCTEAGGIVDDVLVYRMPDHYLMVVNAANIAKDFTWIQAHRVPGAQVTDVSDDITLLAVQGPESLALLQPLASVDLRSVPYYHAAPGTLAGVDVLFSRTGYTGELGFELFIRRASSLPVWEAVAAAAGPRGITLIGLGARDSLRLEMAYCLYGNDITEETNPLEAGLGWITRLDRAPFIGQEALRRIQAAGLGRRLVGCVCDGRALPRHGYAVQKDGVVVGQVTSGTFGPSVGRGIALAYVAAPHAVTGASLAIVTRQGAVPAMVVKPPFHASRVK